MSELILALDMPRGGDALRLLDQLPELRWVKLGPILLTREGPALVRELTGRDLRVFLDLKWHDIPNTVAGAVTAAREIGVAMATGSYRCRLIRGRHRTKRGRSAA